MTNQLKVPLSVNLTGLYFSPNGGCQQRIIERIIGAKERIFLQSLLLTNHFIIAAFQSVRQRNVPVSLILDARRYRISKLSVQKLKQMGAQIYLDGMHRSQHNKILVVDNRLVMTGSFNYTHCAEKDNAENLIELESEVLASLYTENWLFHKAHSRQVK